MNIQKNQIITFSSFVEFWRTNVEKGPFSFEKSLSQWYYKFTFSTIFPSPMDISGLQPY